MADNRRENPLGGWAFGDAPFGPRPEDAGQGDSAVTVQLHGLHDENIALAARHREVIQLHGKHDENIGVVARHIEIPYLHGKHRETVSMELGL